MDILELVSNLPFFGKKVLVFLLCLLVGLFFISPNRISFVSAEEISLPLVYPGAVAREKAPYQSVWSDEPGMPTCLTVRYDVEVTSDKIAKWYYEKLTAAGWKYQGEFDEREYIHLFSKGDKEIRIILKPGGPNIIGIPLNGTLIHFSWREKTTPTVATSLTPIPTLEEIERIPLYPGAKRFFRKEIITLNKCIGGWPESLCTWKAYTVANVSQETVIRWFYDTLTSAGWQFGKTKNNYGWEPQSFTDITPQNYLKGEEVIEIYFQGGSNPQYGIDINGTVFNFCLSRKPQEKVTPSVSPEITVTPAPPEVTELDKQITKDLLNKNPDLKTLLRLYYYYRHTYNDRAGVNAFVWMLKAIFWEPGKKAVGILAGLVNTVQMEIMAEKWFDFWGNMNEVKDLVLKGDIEGAAVLTALNLPDEKVPLPVASLFMGVAKNEYLKWKADSLYKEVLEKISKEDPNFCVFKETYKGKENCYKSWLKYRNAFQPNELSFFGKLPRSVEETKEGEELWEKMTKFGEFSDGSKYTVKEMTGEVWKNAFEDVNWPVKKTVFEKNVTATPTPTIHFLTEANIVDDKKVYLGDKLILDVADYAPACEGIGQILYSPTDDYFLVILGCFEGDNEIILFKADGSGKKQITGRRDVVNYEEVEWEKDGKSFIYHRICGFGADKATLERLGEKDVPEEGMVKYDIATGEKTVVGPYKPPTR